MKNLLIGFMAISTLAFSSSPTDQIDKMVEEIKKPRKGVAMSELMTTPDPFVVLKRDDNSTGQIAAPQKKEEKLTLGGIMNEKAFINGKWLKIGEEIYGYKLHFIGTKGVVLVDETRVRKLFLHEKNKGLITIKEGE